MCLYAYNKQDNNDAQLSKITNILSNQNFSNRDSLVADLKIQAFKEQYYLNQQGIQSDRIIMYVSILFGVFGLLGYFSFNSQFKFLKDVTDERVKSLKVETELSVGNFKSEIQTLKTRLEADYEKHRNKLFESEKRNYERSSRIFLTASQLFYNIGDYGNMFLYKLSSIEEYYFCDNNEYLNTISSLKQLKVIIVHINTKFPYKNETGTKSLLNSGRNTKKIDKIFSELGDSKIEVIKNLCFEIRVELKKFEEKEDEPEDYYSEEV